jgi:hypothetical protein
MEQETGFSMILYKGVAAIRLIVRTCLFQDLIVGNL